MKKDKKNLLVGTVRLEEITKKQEDRQNKSLQIRKKNRNLTLH